MNNTMFPLIIINILENHANEHPLTIKEITDLINKEFEPFKFDKKQLINRTTVMRILETVEFWTEMGNLLNFKVVQCGTEGKKLFKLEKAA